MKKGRASQGRHAARARQIENKETKTKERRQAPDAADAAKAAEAATNAGATAAAETVPAATVADAAGTAQAVRRDPDDPGAALRDAPARPVVDVPPIVDAPPVVGDRPGTCPPPVTQSPVAQLPADQLTAVQPSVAQSSAGGVSDEERAAFFSQSGPLSAEEAAQAAKRARKRKRKPLKVAGIALGVLAVLALAAYAGVALYFSDRFMPNASIGDVDVSLLSSSEAEEKLAQSIDSYTLQVTGQGFSLDLTASDTGLSVDAGAVVRAALADENPWAWPLALDEEHDGTDKLVASYNDTGLDETLRAAVEAFNEDAEMPVDASLAYDDAADAFEVKPEAVGTALDADAVVQAVDEGIVSLSSRVELTEEQLLQPSVSSSDERLVQAVSDANAMIRADLRLTAGGDPVDEVDPDLIAQWIVLDKDLKATLDKKKLAAWVDELAASCNTVGTERTYTRPDGKTFTVSGGPYGWEVDADDLLKLVREGVEAGTQGNVEIPFSTTGTAFGELGTQDWGKRYCDIDLSEQHVRFYDDDGTLVWEADCISGEPDGEHDTPTGVYWVNQKASPSKLIGYENGKKIYESTVQYWMPFVGNVIGLHDADWQPDFGGSMYKQGYGSHGCVNLSPSKASKLYGIIQSGDVVVCHW